MSIIHIYIYIIIYHIVWNIQIRKYKKFLIPIRQNLPDKKINATRPRRFLANFSTIISNLSLRCKYGQVQRRKDLSNLSCVRSQSWDTYRSIIARSIRRAEKKERMGRGRIFNPFLSDRVSCGTNKLVMVSPRGNKSRRNLSRYYRIKTTLSSTGLQLQFSFDDHDASMGVRHRCPRFFFFFFFFFSRKHDVFLEYIGICTPAVFTISATWPTSISATRGKVTRVGTGDRGSTWKLEFPIICERERFRLSARRK